MPLAATLRVTVRIDLTSGAGAGGRWYRLSRELELPPRLLFDGELPVEGAGDGVVSFVLPNGARIAGRARLYYDPERPERGSEAELMQLAEPQLRELEAYLSARSSA